MFTPVGVHDCSKRGCDENNLKFRWEKAQKIVQVLNAEFYSFETDSLPHHIELDAHSSSEKYSRIK